MLRFFRLVSFVSVLCVSSLASSLFGFHPNPGGWLVDVEYLNLLPSIDDTYFVIRGNGTSPLTIRDGQLINNDFKFHSGFRVGGGYAFCHCNRELLIFYTRLCAEQKKTITAPLLSYSIGAADDEFLVFENFTGSAASKLHILYQRLDGFYAQQLFCFCDLNLYLRGGLEWANVRFRERYDFTRSAESGTHLVIDQKSRFWGIGPQFGIDANYGLYEFTCGCFPGRLSLQGWASGSLLIGRDHESAFDVLDGAVLLDVKDQHTWRIVPAFHARVGLNFATCFSRFAGSLEVGYEFNSYIRALRRLFFPDDGAVNLTTFHDLNFDIHGLYVAANFTF